VLVPRPADYGATEHPEVSLAVLVSRLFFCHDLSWRQLLILLSRVTRIVLNTTHPLPFTPVCVLHALHVHSLHVLVIEFYLFICVCFIFTSIRQLCYCIVGFVAKVIWQHLDLEWFTSDAVGTTAFVLFGNRSELHVGDM
jgi:hypothetical protein